MLADAAQDLVGLSDDANSLRHAAVGAGRAADKLSDSLGNLPDHARLIQVAADKAERAASRLEGGY
ncbi:MULTISPECIES: hypothetical protein [unclassified Streptomyces]|uniref:hypothetical protein n=1 Tax=unclassified Streptomyces TaxID=2593676 RepID=UPI00325389DA